MFINVIQLTVIDFESERVFVQCGVLKRFCVMGGKELKRKRRKIPFNFFLFKTDFDSCWHSIITPPLHRSASKNLKIQIKSDFMETQEWRKIKPKRPNRKEKFQLKKCVIIMGNSKAKTEL